ncbi:uncharacterized protein LOC125659646 isoform X4 [Ostrea edulis]|uniref:uncharacterized protein LOC125659646 isoform X4 n=1 Tax=Ostrea edulis TaxID=37623 RepID=UPI0024AF79C1|nr:uncharacterized protein LOC125659646 isoform X4 [Ostrea edulis]
MNLSGLFRFCFPVLGTVLYFCQDVSSVVQFNVTSQSGKMLTVGETFRASCDVGGYTPIDLITNLQVHWKSENGDICLYGEKTKDAPEKYVCSSISGQGISSFVLAVPDVSMEDSGNYTCEVEEKKTSSAMKSSVELQVIELTTVTEREMATTPITHVDETTGSSTGRAHTFPLPVLIYLSSFLVYHM